MLETIQSMLGFLPPDVVEMLMTYVVPLAIIIVKILVLLRHETLGTWSAHSGRG